MGRMCAVFGCGTHSGRNSGVSTHSFPPPESKYRRMWINFVKRTRRDFVQPTKYQGICGLHFPEDSFEDQYTLGLKMQAGIRQRRRLKADSVPTIFTDKCIAGLSKHSPAAAAAHTKNVKVELSTSRENRIKKREMKKRYCLYVKGQSRRDPSHHPASIKPRLSQKPETSKDLDILKRARMGLELVGNVQETTCHTLAVQDATPQSSSAVADDNIKIAPNATPSMHCEDLRKRSEPSTFKDAKVGTNNVKFVYHQGVMANLRPHKRSKAVYVKPQQKSIGTQCDLHTCDCNKKATTTRSAPERLIVKFPLHSISPSDPDLDLEMEVYECDHYPESDLVPDDSDYDLSTEYMGEKDRIDKKIPSQK